MRFTVVTIHPELFESPLAVGVVGRAREAGILQVDFVNPRDFTRDRHRSVDDTPYGGGPGMVMKCEPLLAAIEAAGAQPSDSPDEETGLRGNQRAWRILMSPVGAPLTQRRVRALAAAAGHVVLVCGRYEGIDERVVSLGIDEEISLGDFVLSGGELAALGLIDAVARYVPGVLGEATSTDEESFSDALLEYPQYTRPPVFQGLPIPEILTSGNHEKIRRWRRAQALARTARRRPELLARHPFDKADERLWASLPESSAPGRVHVALVHHPVVDRTGAVVTSAVTNLDIHDIARSAATYGLGSYTLVSPVSSQREKIDRILALWAEEEQRDHRSAAIALTRTAASVEEAIAAIAAAAGTPPLVVATSARPERFAGVPRTGFRALRDDLLAVPERPILLLFGTGWGLADDQLPQVARVLAPIAGRPAFNHLSVRSAVAVVLDRLFGLRED